MAATVTTILQDATNLTTLVGALDTTAGLLEEIGKNHPLTLFGPTDEAFGEWNKIFSAFGYHDYLHNLLTKPEWEIHRYEFLTMHFTLEDTFMSSDLEEALKIPTALDGAYLTVRKIDDGDGQAVISLVPFDVQKCGTGVIVEPDLELDGQNGNHVLHKIDEVLLPPWYYLDIYKFYSRLGNQFSTFLEMVEMADMKNAFFNKQEKNIYTLFAPLDGAFDELPQEDIEYLRNPDNVDDLVKVLNAHTIDGVLPSTMWEDGQVIVSIEGTGYKFEKKSMYSEVHGEDIWFVDGNQLIQQDVPCFNGLLGVIDGLLIPDGLLLPSMRKTYSVLYHGKIQVLSYPNDPIMMRANITTTANSI